MSITRVSLFLIIAQKALLSRADCVCEPNLCKVFSLYEGSNYANISELGVAAMENSVDSFELLLGIMLAFQTSCKVLKVF